MLILLASHSAAAESSETAIPFPHDLYNFRRLVNLGKMLERQCHDIVQRQTQRLD
ncbi:MAG: hypothetical protein V6Z82_04250 [Flavobacteriales bacterium]